MSSSAGREHRDAHPAKERIVNGLFQPHVELQLTLFRWKNCDNHIEKLVNRCFDCIICGTFEVSETSQQYLLDRGWLRLDGLFLLLGAVRGFYGLQLHIRVLPVLLEFWPLDTHRAHQKSGLTCPTLHRCTNQSAFY